MSTMPSRCVELKEQGNAAFKRGDFSGSAALYSSALELALAAAAASKDKDASSGGGGDNDDDGDAAQAPLLYSNRAAAWFGLGEWSKAEADARAAGELSPAFAKAWLRQAMALRRLGRPREALEAARRGVDACERERGQAAEQEVRRVARELQAEVERGAGAGASAAVGKVDAEAVREYNALAEDVRSLDAELVAKNRALRTLEATKEYVAACADKQTGAAPTTFVSVGRAFMLKPADKVQADLQESIKRAADEFEVARGVMAQHQQRLQRLASELEAMQSRGARA